MDQFGLQGLVRRDQRYPALTMGKQETEIEKNRFLCNKCGHTPFYQSELKEHTMRKHNRDPIEKSNECSYCDYASHFKRNLVRHMNTHEDVPRVRTTENKWTGTMNKCEQCSYSTILRANYLVHLRKHNGEKPFKCEKWPYEARQQTILKIHNRSVHENLFSLSASNVNIRQVKKAI